MFKTSRKIRGMDRRAAVVVLVAVTGTLMAGFAALTVDLGNMYICRTELQRTADAAALAGASAYFTNDGLTQSTSALTSTASQRAGDIAAKNAVSGTSMTLQSGDRVLGQHDFTHPTAALSSALPWNAVQVTARRTTGDNGPVPLLFACVWGQTAFSMTASARAAVDDRVAGYNLQGNTSGAGFMPFTIPVSGYYGLIQNGLDVYSYNGNVVPGGDGVREVLMYPWKWTNTGSSGGSGNFGILDMNRSNNGASALSGQISAGGASVADVQAQLHTSTLTFYDANHTTSPITYSCSGTPGMKTSIQSALAGQIGKVFGFFLNNGCTAQGQNATYSICGVFFARIMAVDISGGKNATGLIVQPVSYTDRWITTSTYAPTTYGTMGRIRLVQ